MGEIEEKLKQILYWQLTFMDRDRELVYVDWSQARRGIEKHLLPNIVNLIVQLMGEKENRIRELEEENRRLLGRLNMRTFASDSLRDEQILKLHLQGLSLRKIAKEVQMTPSGVSKALQRLGVYSVDRLKESAEN